MKRKVFLILVTAVLSGCGTFNLGHTRANNGQTPQQHQLDSLACKDEARLAANTADKQAASFLLGLTIVGTPLAWEMERSTQRAVFKTCMEGRGYLVRPPE